MYLGRNYTLQMHYQECKQITQMLKRLFQKKKMNIYVDSVLNSLPVSDVKLIEIKEAQDEDPVCKRIKNLLH